MNDLIVSINSNDKEIKEIFLKIKNIAIIGLSPNEAKDSHKVGKFLQSVGFKIIPVYPKDDIILGETVYKSLLDIPFKVDMVNIFRNKKAIEQEINNTIKKGDVDVVWTQLGLVNNSAAKKAKDYGMQVVQDKCTKIEYRSLM